MSDSSSPPDASPTPDRDSGWSRRTKRLIALVGVVVVIVGLALPKLSGSDASNDGGGGNEEAPLHVEARILEPGSVSQQIRTNGTLRADESVDLSGETAGRITEIRFEEGSRVQKGALLVQLNDADLQAEKKRLEHQLQLASDRADRQKRLLDEGGVSQEEYDATVNEVEVLKAELELAEAQIEKKKIRAPFTGVVGLREVSEGAYVTPQTTITTLQRINPIKINFSVSEKYASNVRPGQTISFTVRGVDRTMEGQVYATATQVNEETRTLQIRARAPNPDGLLRSGMFADVSVTLGTVDDAVVVPSFAVVPTLDGQRVFVADNGTAQPRNVTLGVRTDSTVQVTEGLSLGDTLLTSSIQELQAGQPVRVERLE